MTGLPPAQPIIGIIGGMGPDATVELMRRILRRTPATDDSDHYRLLVDCNPKVPSRIAFMLEGAASDPTATLVAMAQGLERSGATVLAMPCNTAHAFAPAIRAAVETPFIDMLEVAFAALQHHNRSVGQLSFGVLGSPALRRVGLIESRTRGSTLSPVHPDATHEELALAVIRAVKSGDIGPAVLARYADLKRHFVAQGVCQTLVCCTEFSVLEDLLPPHERATLDTLDALVAALIPAATAGRT